MDKKIILHIPHSSTKIINNNETKKENLIYDSTLNYLGKDVYLYIGQELYLNGLSVALRKYGYEGFMKDYKLKSSSLKNTYKPIIPEEKKYIEYDMGGKSIYDSLAGKYFKVINVFPHPEAKKNPEWYGNKFYLELEEKEKKNKLYFEYDSKYEFSFPFFVVGYFEKIRNKYVGFNYVLRSTYLKSSKELSTGKIIQNKPGQNWKCIDLTIEEQYFSLGFILKNDLNEKIFVRYDYLVDQDDESQVFTLKEAETYKKKFGLSNWLTILNEEIKIGFTEEMVKVAWGEPKSINKASYGEQWVYEEQYLYFENGKLKAFN